MIKHFIEHFDETMKYISKDETKDKILETGVYKMTTKVCYSDTREKINKLYEKLK